MLSACVHASTCSHRPSLAAVLATARCSRPRGARAHLDQPPPVRRRRRRTPRRSRTPQRGSALPKTPAEREKTLSDLYALLATADDEDAAKAVSDAIERVWLYSGSATIDLLMERSNKAMAEKKVDLALQLLDHCGRAGAGLHGSLEQARLRLFHAEGCRACAGRPAARPRPRSEPLQGARWPRPNPARDRPEEAALKAFQQLLDVHPYWSGAKQTVEELEREVEGQGI